MGKIMESDIFSDVLLCVTGITCYYLDEAERFGVKRYANRIGKTWTDGVPWIESLPEKPGIYIGDIITADEKDFSSDHFRNYKLLYALPDLMPHTTVGNEKSLFKKSEHGPY